MPDFVLLKIRGTKILPFLFFPFGYLDCERERNNLYNHSFCF
jgi:hypothetical protein